MNDRKPSSTLKGKLLKKWQDQYHKTTEVIMFIQQQNILLCIPTSWPNPYQVSCRVSQQQAGHCTGHGSRCSGRSDKCGICSTTHKGFIISGNESKVSSKIISWLPSLFTILQGCMILLLILITLSTDFSLKYCLLSSFTTNFDWLTMYTWCTELKLPFQLQFIV